MKLYRFRYSCFARKVQMILDLVGARYELVDVPYGDRNELARVASGYIYLPVLVDDAGNVTVDSRAIAEKLVSEGPGKRLVPAPLAGPIWGYSDFVDGPLEDILFRIASPGVRRAFFENPGDRALFTLIKERKFGAGCIDEWERQADALIRRAQHLLAPTLATLEEQPFVFGKAPTLADAALYGVCAMVEAGDPAALDRISSALPLYVRRLEAAAPLN